MEINAARDLSKNWEQRIRDDAGIVSCQEIVLFPIMSASRWPWDHIGATTHHTLESAVVVHKQDSDVHWVVHASEIWVGAHLEVLYGDILSQWYNQVLASWIVGSAERFP